MLRKSKSKKKLLHKEIDKQTQTNFENLRRMAEGWKQLAIKAMNDTKNPEKYIKI